MLALRVHDVVDEVTWQTIDTKTHSLRHLCKTFCFHLVLEGESWEIGSFSMYVGFYKCKRSSLLKMPDESTNILRDIQK